MSTAEESEEIESTGVAQYLAELSQDRRLPEGIEHLQSVVPFQPDEVKFDSNDWLVKTLLVQAWLRLDSPISADLSSLEAGHALFTAISPDAPEACLRSDGDCVLLTPLGAQHLDIWLSRALANRDAFLEAVEEGVALSLATEDWDLLWEEGGANRARQPAAIQARVDTTTIRSFADYAGDGVLDLNPSYQRDSVWSTSDSQLLIDSILRGIPIPSIILTEVGEDSKLQIVDGKQRLTAILRFIGRHPVARKFAKENDVEDLLEKDPRRLVRKLHLRGRDISDNYLPFRLSLYRQGDPLYKLSGKYLADIKDEEIEVGHGKVKVGDIFGRANSKYKIPTIIYEKTRLQDIHHVFSIYNKQGKKLNAEELRNATYHHLGLTKLLLLLSGDRLDVNELAPYLPSELRQGIEEVGKSLEACNFGTLRFKRTKVLSWVSAIFLHEPNMLRGAYATPSTASHIDAHLEDITKLQGAHPMYQNANLVSLARDIRAAVALHAECVDAWSPRFRNKKGQASRWEELPFVASLLAVMVLVAIGKEALLAEGIAAVRDVTEKSPGPTKSQNKTQWQYVARVCLRILDTLGVDQSAASTALTKRYEVSCLEYLRPISEAGGSSE
ncbi:hypothetical protein BSY239_847 [Hydrogenophaga sp. RAC07]|uniref:DUF262 domain-containing protein n=1 Tax=Hydrogenophaga sp. RAC07 TaxID=1842537 RepID=UPI00083D1CB7|nr:DUF262 domain-containing protein [Hydrogenophaga sp. RAC07]AOF85015.1 hypothetical protein BSY239_847 [Hydrogenophaga sp. RAC07]